MRLPPRLRLQSTEFGCVRRDIDGPRSTSIDYNSCRHGGKFNALPHRGTTLILGPPDHLLELFASLCDRWPRCAAAAERAANASSAQSIGISHLEALYGQIPGVCFPRSHDMTGIADRSDEYGSHQYDRGDRGDWIKHAFERWGLPPIRSPFAPSPATERKMETRATAVSFDR